MLGLSKVQNSLVGSPEKRGVSGGQKKRVNIGMELVAWLGLGLGLGSGLANPNPSPNPNPNPNPDPDPDPNPNPHPNQVAMPSFLFMDEPTRPG